MATERFRLEIKEVGTDAAVKKFSDLIKAAASLESISKKVSQTVSKELRAMNNSFIAVNKQMLTFSSQSSKVSSGLRSTAANASKINSQFEKIAKTNNNVRQSFAGVNRVVAGFSKSSNKAAKDIGDLSNKLKQATNDAKGFDNSLKINKNLNDIDRNSKKTADSLLSVRNALVAIIGSQAVRTFISMSSEWTNMASRVEILTGSVERGTDAMMKLVGIANRTRNSIGIVTESYSKNAIAMRDLGYTTQQQLDYTEALTAATRLSGSTAEDASYVTRAFYQAMMLGKLSGENWNSVLENGGRAVKALADGLGVTVDRLREMAYDQKLTSGKIVEGLTNQLQVLRAELEKMPITITDAFVIARNKLNVFVGELSARGGINKAISDAILSVSKFFDTLNNSIDYQKFSNTFENITGIFEDTIKIIKTVSVELGKLDEAFGNFFSENMPKVLPMISAFFKRMSADAVYFTDSVAVGWQYFNDVLNKGVGDILGKNTRTFEQLVSVRDLNLALINSQRLSSYINADDALRDIKDKTKAILEQEEALSDLNEKLKIQREYLLQLPIKSGESYAGGVALKGTLEMAKVLNSSYSDQIKWFAAFNDTYHKINSPNSLHTKGLAFDVTFPNVKEGKKAVDDVVKYLAQQGFIAGKDFRFGFEKAGQGKSTGDHFHFAWLNELASNRFFESQQGIRIGQPLSVLAKERDVIGDTVEKLMEQYELSEKKSAFDQMATKIALGQYGDLNAAQKQQLLNIAQLNDLREKVSLLKNINDDLAGETELARLTESERKVQEKFFQYENQFREKGLSLDLNELVMIKERIKEWQKENSEIERRNRLLQVIRERASYNPVADIRDMRALVGQEGITEDDAQLQFLETNKDILGAYANDALLQFNNAIQRIEEGRRNLFLNEQKENELRIVAINNYKDAVIKSELEIAQARMKSGQGDWMDHQMIMINQLSDGFTNFFDGASKSLTKFLADSNNGIADSVGRLLVYGGSMRDTFGELGRTILSQLLSQLTELGIKAAFNSELLRGLGFSTSAGPSNFFNSVFSGIGSLFGFAGGGYTGGMPVSAVAGIVHGQEFVTNADATRKYRPMLEAMNAGQPVMTTGGGVTVNVNNYSNSGVDVQERQNSDGSMTLDVIVRAVESRLSAGVATGTGGFNKTLQGAFGLRRGR